MHGADFFFLCLGALRCVVGVGMQSTVGAETCGGDADERGAQAFAVQLGKPVSGLVFAGRDDRCLSLRLPSLNPRLWINPFPPHSAPCPPTDIPLELAKREEETESLWDNVFSLTDGVSVDSCT